MKYAIIASGGKQFKVLEGQEVLVDRMNLEEKSEYAFPHILLLRTDSQVYIGNPYVNNAHVKGKVMGEVKGDKITVAKFKAKVHYRRKMGFRPLYTKILITSISMAQDTKSSSRSLRQKRTTQKKPAQR